MQRTTVRLPAEILDEAKRHARRTGRTLTQLIEDGVRSELAQGAVRGTGMRVGEATPRYGDAHPSDMRDAAVDAYDTGDAPDAPDALAARVADMQEYVRRLPRRDRRSSEEILGYDAFGLPT